MATLPHVMRHKAADYRLWLWKQRHLKKYRQAQPLSDYRPVAFPSGTSQRDVEDFVRRFKQRSE